MSNLNVTCAGFIFMAVCKIYNGVWRRSMQCVCVWDVIHCYESMLLNVSPCWGEECPERAVNAPSGGEPACWYTHICSFECVCCSSVCVTFSHLQLCVEFEHRVCTSVWMCTGSQVCEKLDQFYGGMCPCFVTMAIVSGLSRDVHPDDEIRLHQWRGRVETNTGVSKGMSIVRGCKKVGGDGPGNLLMECTKGIIKHTLTHTQLWPDTHMYTQTDHKIWSSWKHPFLWTAITDISAHAHTHTNPQTPHDAKCMLVLWSSGGQWVREDKQISLHESLLGELDVDDPAKWRTAGLFV